MLFKPAEVDSPPPSLNRPSCKTSALPGLLSVVIKHQRTLLLPRRTPRLAIREIERHRGRPPAIHSKCRT